MPLELRDPATGKIKPMYLVAGGAAVLVALYALMKGGSAGQSGVVSGGQSSDISGSLSDLQSALEDFLSQNAALGGNMAAVQGSASPLTASSSSGSTTITSSGSTYISSTSGDSNVSPSVGTTPISNPSNPYSGPITQTPITYTGPTAIAKPSNSTISSAPVSSYQAPTVTMSRYGEKVEVPTSLANLLGAAAAKQVPYPKPKTPKATQTKVSYGEPTNVKVTTGSTGTLPPPPKTTTTVKAF